MNLVAGWESVPATGHKKSYAVVREVEDRRIVASCNHRHSRWQLAQECAERLMAQRLAAR